MWTRKDCFAREQLRFSSQEQLLNTFETHSLHILNYKLIKLQFVFVQSIDMLKSCHSLAHKLDKKKNFWKRGKPKSQGHKIEKEAIKDLDADRN